MSDTTEGWREQFRNITEYNGWTNKPTWLVHLWLTNTQPDSEYFTALAQGCPTEYVAEQVLKNEVEELAETAILESNMFADLLSWSLAYVDWRSIAIALRETE